MRAVMVEGTGCLDVVTVDDPVPGTGEVVVEVGACGLCATDLHLVDGRIPAVSYPVVPGHEFAGTVVGVGAAVSGPAEGDVVAVDPSLPCGRCRYCRAGRGNLCETGSALGITAPGGAAEYVRVAAEQCYLLSPGTSATAGALVEPLACAVYGLDRVPHGLTDHVLIYGACTTGLLFAQLIRRAGVASVSMVDTRMDRLSVAETLGVTAVASDAAVFAQDEGWDLVVEATGEITLIEDGMRRVRKTCTFLQFGLPDPDALARFSPLRLSRKEITIVGAMTVHHSFERARELMMTGAVEVGALVTRTVALENYPEALSDFRAGSRLTTQVLPG